MVEIETTILGGLPVLACFTIEEPDTSVGERYPYPGDLHICTRNGKRAEWAEKRMTKKDWAQLEEEANDYIDNWE